VTPPVANSARMLAAGEIDAVVAFPPVSQELRENKIGHVVVDSRVDRPWSQYFCCMLTANREFIRRNPVATKRAMRAILKANDICAREPERIAKPGGLGVLDAIRACRAGAEGTAVREVARVRRRGHDSLLRPPAARGSGNQEYAAEDHQPGHRLAVLGGVKERVEVTRGRRDRP
jgi:NMT1-like family